MKEPTIFSYEQADELVWSAAQQIWRIIEGFGTGRDVISIGLCGGRSVGALLMALENLMQMGDADLLRKLHFFMVDERLVPLDHDDSNFKGLRPVFFDALLRQGLVGEGQIHPFEWSEDTLAADIETYGQTLRALTGTAEGFDLVLVSAGEDGHIASLFPGHSSLLNAADSFVLVEDSPKPPARRISASRATIANSTAAFLLCLGDAKREALDQFRNPLVSREECPAKLVLDATLRFIYTDLRI